MHSSPLISINIFATWARDTQFPCHHVTHKIINSSATPIKSMRLLQTRTICTNLQNGENLDKSDVATDHSIKKP